MDDRPFRAVVVGGGVAGASCAAELAALAPREASRSVDILLVSCSPVVRVATAGALRCEVEVADKPAEAWARAANVDVVRGVATALNARSIVLSCGRIVPFDACCVATGARPKVPPWPGLTDPEVSARVFTIRDAHSIFKLRTALGSFRRVAIVGNGGIAMELAYELTGCDITWIIKDNHIGNSFFDERSGEQLLRFLRTDSARRGKLDRVLASIVDDSDCDQDCDRETSVNGSGAGPDWLGIREKPILFPAKAPTHPANAAPSQVGCCGSLKIERNCEVVDAARGENCDASPLRLMLSEGTIVHCDAVLCAIGVQPNVEWLGSLSRLDFQTGSEHGEEMGDADVSGGMRVNAESMRSCSRKDVFGAGDCATIVRTEDMSAASGNNWFQMRLWSQAAAAGRAAARGILQDLNTAPSIGHGIDLDMFAHATRFFDHKVILLGRYNAQGLPKGYSVIEGGDDSRFIRVVLCGGRARGALLIGDSDLAETYENLILDGLDLSHIAPSELVDPSVDLEDYFD